VVVDSILLIYSSDGHSVYGSRGREFERIGSVQWVESCKIVFLEAVPVHILRHFCCRMYHLATIHRVTDRQTDRQTDNSITPIITDHTV